MDYTVNKTELYNLIDEEVSLVADKAYAEDGTPLYDGINLTSGDRQTVERYIDDAVSVLIVRTYDICKLKSAGSEEESTELDFYIPDFDSSLVDAVKSELNRYICLSVCASLFTQRSAAIAPDYAARAQAALGKAVSMLKSRKHPYITW